MSQPPFGGPNQPPNYPPPASGYPPPAQGYGPPGYPPPPSGYPPPPSGYQAPPPGYPPPYAPPPGAPAAKKGLPLVLIIPLAMLAVVIVGAIALVLTADNSPAVVPKYTNATSLASSERLKANFNNALKDAKSSSLESYKTTDSLSKVKAFYIDEMKKNGWTEKTNKLGEDNVKTIESAGGFSLAFEKGNNIAAIFGFPGVIATANDIKDVKASDAFFMVIQAQGRL